MTAFRLLVSISPQRQRRERGETESAREREREGDTTILGLGMYVYFNFTLSSIYNTVWGEGRDMGVCSFSGVNPKRYGFPLVFEAIGYGWWGTKAWLDWCGLGIAVT